MMDLMMNYVSKGEYMGEFLTAIFANDLQNSFLKADEENIKLIVLYVSFVRCGVPKKCHGSYEKVKQWMEKNKNEQGNKNS
jgi:hypothetical protein